MDKKSKFLSKKSLVLMAIPFLIFVFFFDNIKGQYRFMQYCKKEGGLRIYELLKKDVGWRAKDYNDAKVAAQLKHVGFVRFVDGKGDGKEYDLRYVGKNPQRDESFTKSIADNEKEIAYLWNISSSSVTDEVRLGRTSFEVTDIKNNKILVSYKRFGYSQFNQERTFLGAPSTVECFREPGKWLNEINRSFVD